MTDDTTQTGEPKPVRSFAADLGEEPTPEFWDAIAALRRLYRVQPRGVGVIKKHCCARLYLEQQAAVVPANAAMADDLAQRRES